jgi:hypothetical protein
MADSSTRGGVAPSIGEVVLSSTGSRGDASSSHRLLQLVSLQQVFDIYIPESVYPLEATTRFVRRLGALSEGATLYQGVDGDWYHETEEVRVLRMSITTVRPDGTVLWTQESIREAIANLVCQLMVELDDLHDHKEEAIFFNDWTAQGTVVRGHPERRARSREQASKAPTED